MEYYTIAYFCYTRGTVCVAPIGGGAPAASPPVAVGPMMVSRCHKVRIILRETGRLSCKSPATLLIGPTQMPMFRCWMHRVMLIRRIPDELLVWGDAQARSPAC